MKNPENIQISIPNICHEEWNTMTPNEKGAFCGKCCKTVIDFTKKTAEEITSIIKNTSSKNICGRFLSNQITEPQPGLIEVNQTSKPIIQFDFRMHSFAIAAFIVFGTSLFSCSASRNTGEQIICNDTAITTDKVDEIEYPIMGEIAPVQNQDSIPVKMNENEPKEYKMGKIKRE